MQFDLVTPEQLLVSEKATYVSVPGSEGSFGVLEGHQPTLSTLNPGVVEVETEGKTKTYFVSYGFVDVSADKVTVLAEEAAAKEDINVEATKTALESVESQLATLVKSGDSEVAIKALEAKVTSLTARLNVALS